MTAPSVCFLPGLLECRQSGGDLFRSPLQVGGGCGEGEAHATGGFLAVGGAGHAYHAGLFHQVLAHLLRGHAPDVEEHPGVESTLGFEAADAGDSV